MQMRKKLYIFKHFAKSKKVIFFQISIILRLIPIKFETLKPPNVQPVEGVTTELADFCKHICTLHSFLN